MNATDAAPTSIQVSVRSIVSIGAFSQGGAIFAGNDPEGEHVRVVASGKAIYRPPVPGEVWKVTGQYRRDEKWGVQFHASRCIYTPARGRLMVPYLASNPAFSGIGVVKAQRLYDAFGDELPEILSSRCTSRLTAVLSFEVASGLVEAWNERQAEGQLVGYLDSRGINPSLAARIRRVWGDASMEVLERNPYHLLAFANWRAVDAAARIVGIDQDDERRLIGAVEAALYTQLQSGHTVTPESLLTKSVKRLLGNGKHERAIELAIAEGAVVGDTKSGYQPVGAAALERQVSSRIRSMLNGSDYESVTQRCLFAGNGDEASVQDSIAVVERQGGFRLNAEQRSAVSMSMTASFSLLLGGAGVGKTTVLRTVVTAANRRGIAVHLMALAGRAAERMAEATGEPASSIARFLASVRARKIEVSPESLIVVDEASMLDLPTMYRILRHTPEGARILLVGDQAQLAPIGFGLVFHTLAKSPRVPSTELIEVHRQAASTGIPTIANSIRSHIPPTLENYESQTQGVSFIECGSNDVLSHLETLSRHWKGSDWRILVAVKNGPSGIRLINLHFHDLNNSGGRSIAGFSVGDPVIHLINDPERDLMNGALGSVAALDTTLDSLVVDFGGKSHVIGGANIEECIDLAYAISVHKAQGSQFRRVAIVCLQSRLFDHSLLYTALTRSVEQVVLLGSRAAFNSAVSNPSLAQLRRTALKI